MSYLTTANSLAKHTWALTGLLVACGPGLMEPGNTFDNNITVADATVGDLRKLDSARPDAGALPDGFVSDAAVVDSRPADSRPADSRLADTSIVVTDVTTPDLAIADAAVADEQRVDTWQRDSVSQDTTYPDIFRAADITTHPDTFITGPDAGVQNYTVRQIQDEGNVNHPPVGTRVALSDLVITAVSSDAKYFFAQDRLLNAYGGIYVSMPNAEPFSVAIGERINIVGVYTEGDGNLTGLAQIEVGSADLEKLGSTTVPSPRFIALSPQMDPANLEMYESMLIIVNDVTVTTEDAGNGEFIVDQILRVDDLFFGATIHQGQQFLSMEGVLNFTHSNYKLEPRSADDLRANVAVASPVPGDLVITEIMKNPYAVEDEYGEWFEVYNTSSFIIDMSLIEVESDSGTDFFSTSTSGPQLQPHDYMVFANWCDSTENGGVTVDFCYAGEPFTLGNGSDTINIYDRYRTLLDRVEYGDLEFPDTSGASMQLTSTSVDNAVGANWCVSTVVFGRGDYGTPGEANTGCL